MTPAQLSPMIANKYQTIAEALGLSYDGQTGLREKVLVQFTIRDGGPAQGASIAFREDLIEINHDVVAAKVANKHQEFESAELRLGVL